MKRRGGSGKKNNKLALSHARPAGGGQADTASGVTWVIWEDETIVDVMAADSVCGNKKTRRNTMGGKRRW